MPNVRLVPMLALVFAMVTPCSAQNYSPGVSAVLRRVQEYYVHGDRDGAAATIRDGVARYPESAQLHFMLGNVLMREHSWGSAIPEYRKAAQLRPLHADTYLNLGYACFHDSKPREAVDAWRIASRQSPNDALIHATLAIGLAEMGSRHDAMGELGSAWRLDRRSEWRADAVRDFRWDNRMRADADKLMAEAARAPGQHSQMVRTGIRLGEPSP